MLRTIPPIVHLFWVGGGCEVFDIMKEKEKKIKFLHN